MTTIPIYFCSNCTSLKNVYIGERVNKIESKAFAGDENIKDIYAFPPVPPTCSSDDIFPSYVYRAATLYVPKVRNAKERYKGTEVWKDFLVIDDSQDMTSIENIEATTLEGEAGTVGKKTFDLNGHIVDGKKPAGVYIINGKKYLKR